MESREPIKLNLSTPPEKRDPDPISGGSSAGQQWVVGGCVPGEIREDFRRFFVGFSQKILKLGGSSSAPPVVHSTAPTSSAPSVDHPTQPTSSAPPVDHPTAPIQSAPSFGNPTTSRSQKRTREEGLITSFTQHGGQSRKQGTLGLATRTRASARLRSSATQASNPNSRGKLVVDLTGDLVGPSKIPGSGPACSWGPPKGGITFRVASPPPLDFDISKLKTSTNIPPPGVEGVVEINKGKTIGRKNDKGKKKIWQV